MLGKDFANLLWDGSLWVGCMFFLQCAGWGLETIHHTHCSNNLYTFFLTSNSDTCRNIRSFAALCSEASNQRVTMTLPVVVGFLRRRFNQDVDGPR